MRYVASALRSRGWPWIKNVRTVEGGAPSSATWPCLPALVDHPAMLTSSTCVSKDLCDLNRDNVTCRHSAAGGESGRKEQGNEKLAQLCIRSSSFGAMDGPRVAPPTDLPVSEAAQSATALD